MQEFDCLNPENNVTGHHFLEASAGTGKTFAIEHIILRLLCESEYALSEILAVTFTKAATRDLKSRIITTIRTAHRLLQADKEHPFLRKEHIPFLKRALASLQDIQVYTLHGFCYHALMKNALDINFPLHSVSPDDTLHTNQIVQAMRDFFRSKCKPPLISGLQFSLLLKKYDLQTLEQKLLPLVVGSAELPQGNLYEEYEKAVKELFQEVDRDNLIEDIYTLAPYYKDICTRSGSIKPEFSEQIEFLKGEINLEKTFHWKKFFLSYFTKENEKKKGPPYHSPAIASLLKTWLPLYQEQTDPKAIFCTLAYELKKWVKHALRKHEVITPDGILEVMRDASNNSQFAHRLREEYKAVIIDEFQDTDPIQWDIFKSLFYNDEYKIPTFYLVGDPKQSIYSFRNADIFTYLKARDSFPVLRSLSTNYRSAPNVIQGLNALFSHPLVETLPVAYVPVKASDTKPLAINDGKKGVHFFRGKKEALLSYIANELIALNEQGFDFGSCVVLVRDRFEAEKVKEALLQGGISSVMRYQGSITESPVFSLVKYMIAVLRDPFALNEMKLLVTHPLIGFTIQDLQSDIWQKTVGQLQQLHTLVKEKGLLKGVIQCMHVTFKEKAPIEKIVEGMQLELWGDYLQLTRLLFSGYTIEELERLGKKGDEKVLKRPLQKENAVTIMTMHLSKGLEFDIVFALGVSSRFISKDPLLRYKNMMIRNRDGDECKAALQEIQQEKLRQLYVALTRAKYRLYIPFIDEEIPENTFSLSPIEAFLKTSFDTIVRDLQNEVSCESVVNQPIGTAVSVPFEIENPEFFDTSTIRWKSALSFSALARPKAGPIRDILPNEIPPGSETGTFFHEAYERIIEDGFYYPYDEEKITEFVRRKAMHTLLEAYVPQIVQTITKSFHMQLHCGIRLVDLPPEHLLPEVEFYYKENETVYKGVIDVLFFFEGKWYVLDWKTTLLEGYSEENVSLGMENHDYFLQARMYAHAVKEFVSAPTDFGGVFYLFLRGLDQGQGVFFCET